MRASQRPLHHFRFHYSTLQVKENVQCPHEASDERGERKSEKGREKKVHQTASVGISFHKVVFPVTALSKIVNIFTE